MSQHHFADRLLKAIDERKTPLIVGLDPVYENLPASILPDGTTGLVVSQAERLAAVEEFSSQILRIAAPHVPAVKINIAYFEVYGSAGVQVYQKLVQKAADIGLLVIGDVKRADIGHTAAQYAKGNLADNHFPDIGVARGPDSVTINPYFGIDGVAPFLEVAAQQGKGLFILLRTSNASAGQIQEITAADGRPMFMHVAELIEKWGEELIGESGFSSVGAVVGATSGQAIAQIRRAMPHTIFLIPGLGAQGGSLSDCLPAFNGRGHGAVISASRSIIFAFREKQYQGVPPDAWTQAVENALLTTKKEIGSVLRIR